MARAVLLEFMAPKGADRADELSRWIDESHIPGVLAVPGCVAAIRYTLSPDQQPGLFGPRHHYLNIWDIGTDSLPDFLAALATRPRTPCAALDVQGVWHTVYMPLGERMETTTHPLADAKVRMVSLVFAGPRDPGRVEEYGAWLDDPHVGEMLRVPACRAGTRYAISPHQPINTVGLRHPFLNIWEVETESGAEYQRQLAAHPRTPTPLVDVECIQHANYEQMGVRRQAAGSGTLGSEEQVR